MDLERRGDRRHFTVVRQQELVTSDDLERHGRAQAMLDVAVAADAPAEAVDAALARIMAAHPWEVPVVEIGSARLLIRG